MSDRDSAAGEASRLAALERELGERQEECLESSAQLADMRRQTCELAAQLAKARQGLLDQERQILQLRRQLERARGLRDVDQPTPRRPVGPELAPAAAQAEADRLL